MSNLQENSVIDTLIWLLRNVCLPITLPLVIYKILVKVGTAKRKSALHGKVVVITGASSGLGEALAHSFYSQGCKVVLAARREEELERVRNDLLSLKLATSTFPPLVVPLDLATISELTVKVQKIYNELDEIDILINNGGVSNRGNVLSTDVNVDMRVMAVNYFGPVALTKAVLPKMAKRKQGHVVFVSSVQGRIAIPDRSSYAASKHALQAFADSLRAEVKQCNIKVSVVSPGYINTALSINALTATGERHGVMDEKTASGYSADFVADKILNAVVNETKEVIICPLEPKLAILLRFLMPSLYFWIIAKRATKV